MWLVPYFASTSAFSMLTSSSILASFVCFILLFWSMKRGFVGFFFLMHSSPKRTWSKYLDSFPSNTGTLEHYLSLLHPNLYPTVIQYSISVLVSVPPIREHYYFARAFCLTLPTYLPFICAWLILAYFRPSSCDHFTSSWSSSFRNSLTKSVSPSRSFIWKCLSFHPHFER